jgi:hypothetical protein
MGGGVTHLDGCIECERIIVDVGEVSIFGASNIFSFDFYPRTKIIYMPVTYFVLTL